MGALELYSGGTTYFSKVGSQTWLGHFYALDLFYSYLYAINVLKLVIFLFKWLFQKGILRFSRSKKSNFEHFLHPTSKQGRVQTVYVVPPLYSNVNTNATKIQKKQ